MDLGKGMATKSKSSKPEALGGYSSSDDYGKYENNPPESDKTRLWVSGRAYFALLCVLFMGCGVM